MFDKCLTIRDVLKRFLELSRSFPSHEMSDVIIDVCATKIVTQFREQMMADLNRDQREEVISALDENIPSRNPLLGNHETRS